MKNLFYLHKMQLPSDSELHEQLNKYFGFRVPIAFVKFILHAITECSKEGYFDDIQFLTYYPFFDLNLPFEVQYDSDKEQWSYTSNERYGSYYSYGLPPELCMFGSMDSLRYGYVVHDPSLQQSEWPVGKVAESEFGVIRYGDDTAQGLESLLAFARYRYKKLGQEKKSYAIEGMKKLEDLEKLFDLDPQPAKIISGQTETYDAGEKRVHIVPPVPAGWHYEPSADGIGVLAPASMFASYRVEGELEDTADIEKLVKNGHYATALLALRDTLWVHWHSSSDPFYEECAYLLKDVYIKMDRPLFAHRVQQQIDYMRSL